jgi:hypothetical protein
MDKQRRRTRQHFMKAIRLHTFGDPEVMKLEEVPDPQPGPGQVVVRVHAVGVNPVETYIRSGIYPKPPVPYTIPRAMTGQESSSPLAPTSPASPSATGSILLARSVAPMPKRRCAWPPACTHCQHRRHTPRALPSTFPMGLPIVGCCNVPTPSLARRFWCTAPVVE